MAKVSYAVLGGGSSWLCPALTPTPWSVTLSNNHVTDDTDDQIRYLERKLALAFRTNLTRYIHDLYL